MAKILGYQLIHQSFHNTHICMDCFKSINISKKYLTEQKKSFGSKICIICEKDITQGDKQAKRDYPSEISNLFETMFKDDGPRFGGVYPRIDDRGSERKKVGKSGAATMPHGIRTPHDPVVFQLEDESLANNVSKFIDKISKKGPIRGKRTDVDDYEIPIFEFEIWYNQ